MARSNNISRTNERQAQDYIFKSLLWSAIHSKNKFGIFMLLPVILLYYKCTATVKIISFWDLTVQREIDQKYTVESVMFGRGLNLRV